MVLVDGLGSLQLLQRRGHVPNLRTLNLEAQITTVAPSTTAAGISALGTGMLPGENAMAGYSLRSPRTGQTFSLIKWDGSGYQAPEWQSKPTLFERLGKDDLALTGVIQPSDYIGSGLSLAALRSAPAYSAQRLDQRFGRAAQLLRTGIKAVYVYWGELDKVGHKHGWQSERWIDELENFDREFGVFLRNLPKGTLVVLTADHGMIDAAEKIDIALNPQLRAGVEQVAGKNAPFRFIRKSRQLSLRAGVKSWQI
ncbi:alkaline phosphatase family protein [Arcanobacterium hippocoleae]